jgi:4-hydroxy-tetrahydrodipicolinate synthase
VTTSAWPVGLLTALVTPLRDDALDVNALAHLIEYQITNGVNGFVVSGGTGEYSTLTFDERSTLIRETVRITDGRVPVIAATGCLATRDTIRLSLDAGAAGVHGILVASSYGEAINWHERYAFYTQVDASVSLPIMIYNTPPAGLLSFDQIKQLAELKNVTAVKDSSGDPEVMGDLVTWAKDTGFGVYVGKDSFLFEAIFNGADGAVFGAANFMPKQLSTLIADLRAEGATLDVRTRWARIRPLLRLTEYAANYVGLCKVGCKLRGIDVGGVRAPYMMPQADEIAAFETSLGLLG